MSRYHPPIKDISFLLDSVFDFNAHSRRSGSELDVETVLAVASEAGKFASERIDTINRAGDTAGSKWSEGDVTTAPGFKDTYADFRDAGWNAVRFPEEYGGQGLSAVVSTVVDEMWHAASLSFALCPMLTSGAVEALLTAASNDLKQVFLPRLVRGEWTGTMNLTEPQAGSDLASIKTKAVCQPDGTYKISGQKIFITYGEHDLAENIVHLVLARTPDAPPGVKGISLFVVPKFLVNSDGSLGGRNDLRCASIEHKLGIHGSPTAVMLFGEYGGATGYLVGEENRGLEYMFIMMNEARFAVGLQGLAISDRAYQHALAYAQERIQGTPVGENGGQGRTILHHPDVRRQLLSMRSQIDAMRSLAIYVAMQKDVAHSGSAAAQRRMEFMIPIVKGWFTETAQKVTYDALQVFGGMGFIEETGAAQYSRDARILTIYEGTTAIQANDLVGRKTLKDSGEAAMAVLAEMVQEARALADVSHPVAVQLSRSLLNACGLIADVVLWLRNTRDSDPRAIYAGAVPYLEMWGICCGGWMHALRLRAACRNDMPQTRRAEIVASADFFAAHYLSQLEGKRSAIKYGAYCVLNFPDSSWNE